MGPDGLIQLGSVASFLSEATPRALRVPAVDQYKLRMGENGMLICDLFIEDKETRTSKVCSFDHLQRDSTLTNALPLIAEHRQHYVASRRACHCVLAILSAPLMNDQRLESLILHSAHLRKASSVLCPSQPSRFPAISWRADSVGWSPITMLGRRQYIGSRC